MCGYEHECLCGCIKDKARGRNTPRAVGKNRPPNTPNKRQSPQGIEHRGRKFLFSFKELLRTRFFYLYNQRRRVLPAERAACLPKIEMSLFYRSLSQIVHWSALLSSKFSQVGSVHNSTSPLSVRDPRRVLLNFLLSFPIAKV